MRLDDVLAAWRGGLIVSCQAPATSPMSRPEIIAALAQVAAQNGSVGVRIDGPSNVRAVRKAVGVAILGIEKLDLKGSDVYITPTYESARRVAEAGANVIALDGTTRKRPGGEDCKTIIARIREELKVPVMADVATAEEGIRAAEEFGAEFISTTLSGYTPETAGKDVPDFALIERLAGRLTIPVVSEGRLHSPEDVRRAFDSGAFAVVVGTAITGIDWLVRKFAAAAESAVAADVVNRSTVQ
jgi:N-acylglucosamine-6-phosphate 2-epimerase